jgi:alpha-tubulin suppressor-like RCC1 family protein
MQYLVYMGIKLNLIIFLFIVSIFIGVAAATATAATATDIVAVDSGGYAHFALASDGTVWAWGNNMYGQMGDAAKATIEAPFKVQGLTGVKAISSDGSHTVILKEDGSVWAAGKNDHGQLGDGTTTARTGFVQCKGLGGITAISANNDMALAVKNDGTVWVWGYYAQGSAADKNVATPEQVGGLSDIQSISAGNWHYLAVDKNGDAYGWGENINGQLGMSLNPQKTPAKLGISGVKQAAAGYQYSLFLKNDGTVWGMGWNNRGVLGIGGSSAGSKTPVQVPGLSGIVKIDAISESGTALKDDGTVYIWGATNSGSNLIGLTGTEINTPTALPVPATTKSFAVSNGILLLLQQNGTVFGVGGTLFYRDPETSISANGSKLNQIKFVSGSATTAPTAPPGATTQPTAAPTQASAGSATKTPAPSALILIGILSLVAVFAMRKK